MREFLRDLHWTVDDQPRLFPDPGGAGVGGAGGLGSRTESHSGASLPLDRRYECVGLILDACL